MHLVAPGLQGASPFRLLGPVWFFSVGVSGGPGPGRLHLGLLPWQRNQLEQQQQRRREDESRLSSVDRKSKLLVHIGRKKSKV